MNLWVSPQWEQHKLWILYQKYNLRTAQQASLALGNNPFFTWMNIFFEWIKLVFKHYSMFEWIIQILSPITRWSIILFSIEWIIWMNNFSALFNVWMNNPNLSPRAKLPWPGKVNSFIYICVMKHICFMPQSSMRRAQPLHWTKPEDCFTQATLTEAKMLQKFYDVLNSVPRIDNDNLWPTLRREARTVQNG